MSETISSSKVLFKGWGVLTRYGFRYRKPNGELDEMSREVYNRGQSAAVLLYSQEQGTVVLVKQFRPAPLVNGDDPYLLEAVAGLLDEAKPEDCARRESVEEAGITVQNLRLVAAAYSHPGALTEVVTMFIGTFDDNGRTSGGGLVHEGEHIEVVEMPFDKAYDLIASGGVVDMKTILLLQHLKIERLLSKA